MAALGSIVRIPQTVRNLGRVREIGAVLAKYGFDELVDRLGVEGFVEQGRRLLKRRIDADRTASRLSVEARIRCILEELGPTYVKFGQILATRPDLLPMSLIEELRKLQDDVPPFSGADARAIVEHQFGKPVDALFSTFDDVPVAAASIAQVHRATLPGDVSVAVKVQRPGLARTLETDLDILAVFAELLHDNLPEFRRYDPRGLVDQFARSIRREIDFTHEAFNITKFAENFADVDTVRVPQVHSELTGARVLTMDWIDGIKADDVDAIDAAGLDRPLLASRATEAVLKMIFVDGFFHADPHPGNVFMLPDNVLCFVDYGMMGRIDEERIDELLAFLVGLLTGDMDRVVELFRRLDLIDDRVDVRSLKREIAALVDRYGNVALESVDFGAFISEVFETVQRHEVAVPSDLMLMGKALATMEGVARELSPSYDPLSEMRSYLLRIYTERLTDPAQLARGTYKTLDSYLYLARRLPAHAESILTKLRRGELVVRSEDPAQTAALRSQARAQHLIALSVVVVALSAASTALLLSGAGPVVFGVPALSLLGLAGYTAALFWGTVVVLASARGTWN